VEIVMKKEEETPIPEVEIVEPDVKLAESVIEISNTAKNDILQEVSKDGFRFTTIIYIIYCPLFMNSFRIKENMSFPRFQTICN
jgi:hypothetical protein